MEKSAAFKKLLETVSKEVELLKKIQNDVRDGVTSAEAKQEGKYDTRALLDSYLSGGHEKRILMLSNQLEQLKLISLEAFANQPQVGNFSLVTTSKETQKKHHFIVPFLGGYKIDVTGETVLTLNTETPLASQLIELTVGETIESGALKGWEIFAIS